MKTFWIVLSLVVALQLSLSAQTEESPNAVTAKVVMLDHYTPYLDNGFAEWDQLTSGLEIGYTRWINRSINLHVPLRFGMADLRTENGGRKKRMWNSLDATLQLKLFDNTKWINPYLTAGLGAVLTNAEDFSPQAPAGGGINFRIMPGFWINSQMEYRLDFKEDQDNIHYSAGAVILLGEVSDKPKDTDGDGIADLDDACPLIAGSLELQGCPDSDGDGIADKDDKCPSEAGAASLMGCPDQDNDGIADADDACPEAAGPAETNGCPDTDGDGIIDNEDACPDKAGPANLQGCPDSDNDGIADKDDKCPNQAGLAANMGCPEDADGDGVADADDRCPNEAGPASNKGCPELKAEDKEIIDLAIQNVNFQSNSSILTEASKPILDQLAEVLRRNPAYSCSISGHTDNTGETSYNQFLSEKRAKRCYDYLIAKDIDPARLSHAGYGETNPVADNSTPAGREQNRRVVFDLNVN